MGMQLPEPPPKTTPSTTPPPLFSEFLEYQICTSLHWTIQAHLGLLLLALWRFDHVHRACTTSSPLRWQGDMCTYDIYIYRKAATNLLRKQTSWIRMYETLSIVGYNGMNYSTHQLRDFHSSPSNKSSAVHFWHPLKNRSILSFSVYLFSWTIMKSCTFCKSCILKPQKIKTSNWWYHIHYIHIYTYI